MVLPTAMWGCEAITATRIMRRSFDVLQRAVIAHAMRLPRRPTESVRLVTTTSSRTFAQTGPKSGETVIFSHSWAM